MKKVILSLFALVAMSSVQARVLSSDDSSGLSTGVYSSDDSSSTYSGKLSSDSSSDQPEVTMTESEQSTNRSAMSMLYAKSAQSQTSQQAAFSTPTKSPKSKKEGSANSRISKFYIAPSFANLRTDSSDDLKKESSVTGFLMGFDIAKNVYKEVVFISFGLDMSYNFMSYGYEGYLIYDVSLLDFTIPINVGANIKLGEKYSVRPYVGFGMSIGAMGEYAEYYDDYYRCSIFNLEDSHRVRFGAQYGIGFTLRRFYLGVEGRSQFTDICDGVSVKSVSLLLGVTF